jgi:copper resistance protein D
VDDLIIASRLVHFAALALLFGGSLFRLLIRPQDPNQRQPWPHSIDIMVVVAALLSWLGWFIGTAASMTGEWSEILESDILEAVLFETQFGRLWIGRLALLAAILTLTLAWRRQIRAREGFMLLLSGMLTASLAGVGHGSIGTGSLGLIHPAADMAPSSLCGRVAWRTGLPRVGFAPCLEQRRRRIDRQGTDYAATVRAAGLRRGRNAVNDRLHQHDGLSPTTRGFN